MRNSNGGVMEPGDVFGMNTKKLYPMLSEANAPWSNGAYLAVSIVYVGGLDEHRDLALPLLRQLSLPATFFLDPINVIDYVRRWESVKATPHEIGLAPFSEAQKSGFIPGWTQGAFGEEVRSAKQFCREVFGVAATSLYHPGHSLFGDQANFSVIAQREFQNIVTSVRGINDPMTSTQSLESHEVLRYPDQDFRAALAAEEPRWIIIPYGPLFEGDNTKILMHRMLLESVGRERKRLRIGTVSEIAAELRKRQSPVH